MFQVMIGYRRKGDYFKKSLLLVEDIKLIKKFKQILYGGGGGLFIIQKFKQILYGRFFILIFGFKDWFKVIL